MGALVNHEQRQDVQDNVNRLVGAGCDVLLGGQADFSAAGAFFPPTLLYCPQPDETPAVHAIEAFGPVATLMPYQNVEHAMTLARAGEGSLAGTLVTASGELARAFILGAARAHDLDKEALQVHGARLARLALRGLDLEDRLRLRRESAPEAERGQKPARGERQRIGASVEPLGRAGHRAHKCP